MNEPERVRILREMHDLAQRQVDQATDWHAKSIEIRDTLDENIAREGEDP